MNLNLFLIILVALIIIICIILYNGIRILLNVEKKKSELRYEFKISLLKIPIFKRVGTKGSLNPQEEDLEQNNENEENPEDKKEPENEDETEKGLKEKYEEIKPVLKTLQNAKDELIDYLNNILKSIDIKKLEGNLIIGLNDHETTIKIASWIWAIGAIVNTTSKPTSLTVQPKFTEDIIDFEGNINLKVNLLTILIYTLILISKKRIRELIKEILDYMKKRESEPAENTAN